MLALLEGKLGRYSEQRYKSNQSYRICLDRVSHSLSTVFDRYSSIHLPPDKYDFYDKLKLILDSIWIKRKNIILMGDLNSDLFFRVKAIKHVYYGRRLLKILNPFGMKNVIKSTTRITEDTATTIDLIIVSDTSKILNSGTFELAISDHKLVFATLKLCRYNPHPIQYSKRFATTKILIKLNFKGHLNEFPGG